MFYPVLGFCPEGPSSGANRVNRGGSWNNNAANTRAANRNRNNPDNRNNNLGLRLALSPAPRARGCAPADPVKIPSPIAGQKAAGDSDAGSFAGWARRRFRSCN